ncbi:dihydrofolate reductase family protein [Salinicoccus hispanicus]|uniref:Dihydrofolate reductase n=1 Tax=Salinicoccus hispanicus TaxID=157225 RepID=A0A6N8TYX6_9STAP|nr:dihydrofolate reductase family protein [Salinicoccus hispanicus]MXQ51054.1 dihydrofolate reductase [Salinicoccus hispanicus]
MENEKRRVVLDLAVTLDGFIEGENGEIDWCIMDPDMDFMSFLASVDTILYGRKSYELAESLKPGSDASDAEVVMWQLMDSKEKYVFSRTQDHSHDNIIYINDGIPETINRLKQQPGKDLWLYGGAELITVFINQGLIDEYRLSIHPVVLGAGKPLFGNLDERLNLDLKDTRVFKSGVVQLIYGRD